MGENILLLDWNECFEVSTENYWRKGVVIKATDSCVLTYRPIQSAKSMYNFLVFVSVFCRKYAYCVKHSCFNLFFFQIFNFSTHFPERFFMINCCLTWFLYPLNSTISVAANIRTSGVRFSKDPKTLRARKAIGKTTTCLFCKAGLVICYKGNKNWNKCEVLWHGIPSFWRYKYYVTWKVSGLSRNGPISDAKIF